jgi:TPR repeat protein
MSFSSFRRWVNRSTNSGTLTAPALSPAAHAEVLFLQGLNFASGQGVARDYVRAAQCYNEAAEQGHCLAQANLATLYERGQGVARDGAKALIWLSKAAHLGNAAAQYRLGVHEHLAWRRCQGGAAAEGRIEALKWVRLSASQGCRDAQTACEFVALGMTREEVTEGGLRAAAFVAVPNTPSKLQP